MASRFPQSMSKDVFYLESANSSDTYVYGFTFFFVCDEDECFRWRRIIRLDEDSFRLDTLILFCLTTFGTVQLLRFGRT